MRAESKEHDHCLRKGHCLRSGFVGFEPGDSAGAGTRNRLYEFFAPFSMLKQDSRNGGLVCYGMRDSQISSLSTLVTGLRVKSR